MSATRTGIYTIPVEAGKEWRIRYVWQIGQDGTPPHGPIERAEPPIPSGFVDFQLSYYDGEIEVDLTEAVEVLPHWIDVIQSINRQEGKE